MARYLAVAVALLAIPSCLLSLLGALYFAASASPLDFLGPIALIAMLPAVVFKNLVARIAFWLLAGTFMAWQIGSLPWQKDWPFDPWFVVPQASMLFLFLLLVWRGLRSDSRESQPAA